MTLKTRFALSFIGNTIAVIALFGGTYYVREQRAAREIQREEQLNTVRTAATQCSGMHLSENPVAALNYINVARRDASILSIACLDPRGRFQVHSDPKMIGKSVVDPAALAIMKGQELDFQAYKRGDSISVLTWYAPVRVGSGIVSWAEVSYNRDILEAGIRRRLWETFKQLSWVAAFTFVLAIVLGLVLAWSLSAPIGGLVKIVRAIAAGDLKQHTELVNRNDELGFLANEMNAMAARLAELDEIKDDFISSVSHDLRSPVTAMRMFLDWMLEGDSDKDKVLPKHRTWLFTLRENALRLNTFVTNILDSAKMKAGKMEYHLQKVSPQETIKTITRLFELMAANQDITLKEELSGPLPDILADPERFDQVITNLVSNALKFTKRGGWVVLGARPGGEHVEIYVADNGRGISKEDLGKLFERFQQFGVSSISATGMKGSGIGLTISRDAIEAMGGSISVESELGKGTRFTIRMPVYKG